MYAANGQRDACDSQRPPPEGRRGLAFYLSRETNGRYSWVCTITGNRELAEFADLGPASDRSPVRDEQLDAGLLHSMFCLFQCLEEAQQQRSARY